MHEMYFTEKELLLLRDILSAKVAAMPDEKITLTIATILKKIKVELEVMD